MTKPTTLLNSSLCITLLFAASCVVTQQAEEDDYNEMASGLGAMLAGSDSSGQKTELRDLVALSAGETPVDFTHSAEGSIVGRRGNLDFDFAIACQSLDGTIQSECDETTDQAQVDLNWSGAVDWPRYDATVNRTGSWALRGIQSGTAVFDGEGTFDMESDFVSLDERFVRTRELAYAARYENVLVDVATRVVQEGTATFTIHYARTGTNPNSGYETELDIEAVVTFTGNDTATIDFDSNRFYDLDLVTGIAARN